MYQHLITLIITKFLQQNIELGKQVCTASFSKQHFLELLSSSLVECLLLTPKFPGSNPETRELWEEERNFRGCTLSQKGPTGAARSFKC